MKKLTIIMFALALITTARAQSFVTTVPVGPTSNFSLWKDTSLYVTNGETIRINANGVWTGGYYSYDYSPGAPIFPNFWDQGFTTADGLDDGDADNWDNFFSTEFEGSLIAYIGSNPTMTSPWPQTNGFWEVGSSVQFVANTSGELWLGLNNDANSGAISDNDGAQTVQIFTNTFSTNDLTTQYAPTLCNGQFSGFENDAFLFSATNGPPFSLWAVYDSSDATNWVFIGSMVLDATGSNTFNSFNDGFGAPINNLAAVPRRYYKLDNGMCHTDPYGYRFYNVQFSYSGSPQQSWFDSFNINGYWNVLQGDASLLDGSGSPSDISLYFNPSAGPAGGTGGGDGLGDPPCVFYTSISAGINPLFENGMATFAGSSYQLVLNLDPTGPVARTNQTYNVYFYSTNSVVQPATYHTTFALTNYTGYPGVSISGWSSQQSGQQTDPSGTGTIPYVTFTNLVGGTWTFNLSGGYVGPFCNGIQIIQIGGPPIELY